MDFTTLVDVLQKVGARHGKQDKADLQACHDSIAKLVDGAHCVGASKETTDKAIEKAGARHSRVDLDKIRKAHDLICEVGADCSTTKVTKSNENHDEQGRFSSGDGASGENSKEATHARQQAGSHEDMAQDHTNERAGRVSDGKGGYRDQTKQEKQQHDSARALHNESAKLWREAADKHTSGDHAGAKEYESHATRVGARADSASSRSNVGISRNLPQQSLF